MKRSTAATWTLVACAPLLAGCQFLFTPDEDGGPVAARIESPAATPLPAAGALELAVLRIHARQASNQWVYLHRITAPWSEESVTWNSFAAAYEPLPIDSLRVDAAGWCELVLTEQVLAWGTGGQSDHGLLLRHAALATPRSVFDSREDALSPPQLLLWMQGPGGLVTDSLSAAADAFIWRAQANANYGDRNPLYAGWAQPQASLEMQALLRFDVPVFPTTALVGDRVWLDADADGIQDPEETGLAGVTVELQDALRRLLVSAVSDSSGAFVFAEVEPGDYMLRVQSPAGYAATLLQQGTDPALDSNLDPDTGFTPVFSLSAGQIDRDCDIGLRYAPVTQWQPRSLAFWIRHSGLGHSNAPDLVTPLLPLWLGTPAGEKSLSIADAATAVAVLRQRLWDRCEAGPNPITALRAQLLTAKLNLAQGAENDIAAALVAGDGFLAGHEPADWSGLSRAQKRQVLKWTQQLRRFNQGRGWLAGED
jgi:hypothetical protein